MRLRALGIIFICVMIAAIGAFFVFGWMAAYPTYTYRYRMTVTVDVNGQIRSGASVIEVQVRKQLRLTPETTVLNQSVRGEAVFVDLGENGNVVALLASGSTAENSDFPAQIVPKHFRLNLFESGALTQLPSLRGDWELSGKDLPTLVAFSNLNDPNTARVVSPTAFAQVFGTGVHLRGIAVEMTTDPVTRRLEQKLPWLVGMISRGLGGTIYGHPERFIVNVPYFVRN